MNHQRRDFIFLSVSLGMCALGAPRALASAIKKASVKGPLVAKVDALLRRLDRREISAGELVAELGKRYDEMDWRELADAPHPDNDVTKIFEPRPNDPHGVTMVLFSIGANSAHPPHAHHDLLSAQCVLKGQVQLRQYDRVARIDADVLALKPTNDTTLGPGGCILMTEQKDNVHWFGAGASPALVLNVNAAKPREPLFDPPGSRNRGRYYVDPTSGERHHGLVVAHEIGHDDAMSRFSRRPLTDFS